MSIKSKDVLQKWRVSVPEMRLHWRNIVMIYCWNRLNTHSLFKCLNVSCQTMNSNRCLLDKESYFYANFWGSLLCCCFFGIVMALSIDMESTVTVRIWAFIFNEFVTDAHIHTLSRSDSIASQSALLSVCVREEVYDRRHAVFFPLFLSFWGFLFLSEWVISLGMRLSIFVITEFII